ncbi:MAG: DUF1007 family protein [Rhizobiaceae bacterium]|nr:MAG: DUF1007 family protein [Rhizobiaceae bacterium]
MPMKNTRATLVFSLAALALSTMPARVHPHVFAEARLDVVLSSDRSAVSSLRHLWRFDDVFSSTVLMEFDKNADLKLDDAELKDVADTVYTSIADYDYFQMVTADGKDVAMNPPPSLMVNYENDQLVILFESQPKEPIRLSGKLDFGVYDPTFYTAIDFVEDENMSVEHLPSTCTRAVIRPDPDEALAQNQATLTEQFFDDPAGTDMSRIFATRLELSCAAEG